MAIWAADVCSRAARQLICIEPTGLRLRHIGKTDPQCGTVQFCFHSGRLTCSARTGFRAITTPLAITKATRKQSLLPAIRQLTVCRREFSADERAPVGPAGGLLQQRVHRADGLVASRAAASLGRLLHDRSVLNYAYNVITIIQCCSQDQLSREPRSVPRQMTHKTSMHC